MKLQEGRKAGKFTIRFGEGVSGWAFPDVSNSDENASDDIVQLKSIADAMQYLCCVCQSNEIAVQKLLSVRRFYRTGGKP